MTWIPIVVALIGAGGTLGGVALNHWWRDKKDLRTERIQGLVYNLLDCPDILSEAMLETGAIRVLVCKAWNGGGKPRRGVPVHSSILLEDLDVGNASLKRTWQNQPVDDFYAGLLEQLDDKDHLLLHTEELEGDLEALYTANGICQSEWYKLWSDDKLLYLSVHYAEPKDLDAATRRDAMRRSVSTLRPIFAQVGPYL